MAEVTTSYTGVHAVSVLTVYELVRGVGGPKCHAITS